MLMNCLKQLLHMLFLVHMDKQVLWYQKFQMCVVLNHQPLTSNAKVHPTCWILSSQLWPSDGPRGRIWHEWDLTIAEVTAPVISIDLGTDSPKTVIFRWVIPVVFNTIQVRSNNFYKSKHNQYCRCLFYWRW